MRPIPLQSGADAKRRILEAAHELVNEKGAAHLTFDAIAARTGISKGGVLHHFRSKRELIKAMVDLHAEQFVEAFDRQLALHGDARNAGIKAYLAASLEDAKQAPTEGERSLMAAVANEPSLLDGMRVLIQQKYRTLALERTADRERAATLMLATAGLLFHECFAMDLFTAEERDAIERHLLQEADTLRDA